VPSRELHRAARKFADRNSERIHVARTDNGLRIGTIASVTGGAASDGLAVVTVTVRGQETTAAGYNVSYTPVVGQRVRCSIVDQQLFVDFAIGGAP
jgi:hypothetical protein